MSGVGGGGGGGGVGGGGGGGTQPAAHTIPADHMGDVGLGPPPGAAVATFPSLQLENGVIINDVVVAYSCYGTLNAVSFEGNRVALYSEKRCIHHLTAETNLRREPSYAETC